MFLLYPCNIKTVAKNLQYIKQGTAEFMCRCLSGCRCNANLPIVMKHGSQAHCRWHRNNLKGLKGYKTIGMPLFIFVFIVVTINSTDCAENLHVCNSTMGAIFGADLFGCHCIYTEICICICMNTCMRALSAAIRLKMLSRQVHFHFCGWRRSTECEKRELHFISLSLCK